MTIIGTMPICLANAVTASNTLGSVSACDIISARLRFQISLAKCIIKNLAGRSVNLTKSLGNMVDELLANTVFSGAAAEALL